MSWESPLLDHEHDELVQPLFDLGGICLGSGDSPRVKLQEVLKVGVSFVLVYHSVLIPGPDSVRG